MGTGADRILLVGNYESDVGYAWWLMERFWEAIARRYPGRVTISFKRIGQIPQRLVDSGANFIELDFNPRSAAVPEVVRQHGFKHLYLTDQPYYCSGYARLRRAGVESIIVHDHTPGVRSPAKGAKRLLKSAIAHFSPWTADAYIAVSDLVLERFSECVCLPAHKCYLARNGIDIDLNVAPSDIRAELNIPTDAIVVVSSSRATKYKRVHHIIEAATRVRDAYFVHCGDGPDMDEFKQLISSSGLEGRVFMLGRRSDVPGVLQAADIAVHASTGEVGMSLAILEFMRAGLPIVLSDCPTLTQAVSDGVTALLFPRGSVDGMAQRLQQLVEDREQRLALGQAARKAVRQFDINHTVDSVLRVFEALKV